MAVAGASTVEKGPLPDNDAAAAPYAEPRISSYVSKLQHAATTAYRKIVVQPLLWRKSLGASEGGRRVLLSIEHAQPLTDTRHGRSYISNDIRTSRYTVFDFIPKQLFFQFSRIGNFYFLCVGIPQTVCCSLARAVAKKPFGAKHEARFLACPPLEHSPPSCRCCSLSSSPLSRRDTTTIGEAASIELKTPTSPRPWGARTSTPAKSSPQI